MSEAEKAIDAIWGHLERHGWKRGNGDPRMAAKIAGDVMDQLATMAGCSFERRPEFEWFLSALRKRLAEKGVNAVG